jgi:DNA-binding MarR family transcriptional regulator
MPASGARRRDQQLDVLDRLLELTVLLSADMARGLARIGLTTSRVRVVWEVAHRGPSTQRTLSDVLGVAPRTVTGLVDALVDTGFVERRPHPGDRRATLVTLTKHGESVALDLVRGRADLARVLLADVGDRRLGELRHGLDAVLATLHRELGTEVTSGA